MHFCTLAPYRPQDFRALVRLLHRSLPAEAVTEAAFARKVLLDPNFDPSGAFVAWNTQAEPLGFLLALARRRPLEDGPPDSDRGWITLFAVEPEARRQGVGTALLKAAEDWLRAQSRETVWISPYAPNYWTPGVDEDACSEGLAFLHRRGYATAYRPLSMDASLVGWRIPKRLETKERELAAQGIDLRPFCPDSIPLLNDFLRREFPGDWQRYARETMLEITAGRRPAEELWMAVRQGEVLGFAQSEGERFGPFGVAQAARGQGLGATLLYRSLEGMQRRGYHNAWFLWTDDATAQRLYRPAGFRETRRYAVLRKSLLLNEVPASL